MIFGGAGAIVMDVIASNDKRRPHEQIQRIRELRPDMVLLSGGTDGGNTTQVVQLAELVAPAKPRPRFGSAYQLPIIFAGNAEARGEIERVFGAADDESGGFDLSLVDKVEQGTNEESVDMALRLAQEEGLLVGISCGAAAAAAIRLAEKDEYAGKTIVVVLPDLAERYLSSVMFAEVPTGIIEQPVTA